MQKILEDKNRNKEQQKRSMIETQFFENINNIDKLLARCNKKKRERAQVNKIRNEKKLQLISQKYKGS